MHQNHTESTEPWPVAAKAVTYFVADKNVTREFYTAVFGMPPIHEDDASVVFRVGTLLINLLQRGNEVEFIAPATAGPVGAAPVCVTSIEVRDVDAAAAFAVAGGARLVNGPETKSWGVRSAVFADPDGHFWEICC